MLSGTETRWQHRPGRALWLEDTHPAVAEGRTLFPTTVHDAADRPRVLISGVNSAKVGKRVTKGRWKGMPIYTLTLEERATCPRSCAHWADCYGNHMHWSKRIRAGVALEERLFDEVTTLAAEHPKGFAIRLHILGDFYSVEYVQLWSSMLDRFRQLRVFGFTARTGADDPIAIALRSLVAARWDRFAIRFSGEEGERGTATVAAPQEVSADTVLCPQQSGRTASCGTCALCWGSRRRIAFLQH